MTYGKRFIVNPKCAFEDVTIVNTLPFGHIDLDMYAIVNLLNFILKVELL